jgi:predicted kinase
VRNYPLPVSEGDRQRHAVPLLVLVRGAPGSGKTTLASEIAGSLKVFHLERDDIWDGLRFTSARGTGGRVAHGVAVWYETIALLMSRGVSLVADGTLYRDEDEQKVATLLPLGDVVNVHCRCGEPVARYRARKQRDGVSGEELRALTSRIESIYERVTEPLMLDCRSVVVNTTAGFEPELADILQQITSSPTQASSVQARF